MTENFDIIIVGTGFAGQTLAHALAKSNLQVALLDAKKDLDRDLQTNFDGRATTVSASSVKMLSALKLWDNTLANQIKSIGIRQQHPARTFSSSNQITFHTSDIQPPCEAFGLVVENQIMRQIFLKNTLALQNTKLFTGATVSEISSDENFITVKTSQSLSLSAKLLIGADGAKSTIRKLAKLDPPIHRYSQNAVVCSIEHSQPHNNHADELYTFKGPFAVLPMTKNRSNIVISHSLHDAEMLMKQNDQRFLQFIRQRIAGRLGDIALMGQRFSYPLFRLRAKRLVTQRVALVADAAHVIHPVAGQGLNLGFRDVAALAQVVVDALENGQDFGLQQFLNDYQKWRQLDILALTAFTDLSHRLFDNNRSSLHFLRSISLQAMQNSPFLKARFIKRAMGVIPHSPVLLEGQLLTT